MVVHLSSFGEANNRIVAYCECVHHLTHLVFSSRISLSLKIKKKRGEGKPKQTPNQKTANRLMLLDRDQASDLQYAKCKPRL